MMASAGDIHDMSSRSGSLGDGKLTGHVGTALYVSPEMMIKGTRGTYSKVSVDFTCSLGQPGL